MSGSMELLRLGQGGYIKKPRLRWVLPDVQTTIGRTILPQPPVDLDYKLTTAFIRKCKTVSQVSAILQLNEQNLSPINIVAALSQIGALYKQNEERKEDVERAHDVVFKSFELYREKFKKWETVVMLWGMVKSECTNKEFYKLWLKDAVEDISSYSARSISLALWCLSQRGWDQSAEETLFTDAAIRSAQTHIGEYEGMDISTMVIALAKNEAQIGDPFTQRLFDLAAQREIQIAANQSTQGLVNTLWAYARLRISVPEMVKQINYEVQLRPQELTPQQISVLLWSYMRLSFFDEKTFLILAQRINEGIDDFSAQGISGIMYSFCWYLEHFTTEHQKMFNNAKNVFKSRADEFEPIHITNMLFAYSSISSVRGEALFDVAVELLEFAVDLVIRDFQKFDVYCISIIALSYGRMGLADDQLFEMIQIRVENSINDFKITNLVTLLYGITLSGRQNKQVIKVIVKRIMEMGESLLQQKYLQMLQKSLNSIRFQDEELQILVQKFQAQYGYQKWDRVGGTKSPFQDWLSRSNSLKYYDDMNAMRYDENFDMNSYDETVNEGSHY